MNNRSSKERRASSAWVIPAGDREPRDDGVPAVQAKAVSAATAGTVVPGRTWYVLGGRAPGGGDVVGTLALDRDVSYSEDDAVGHVTGSSPFLSSTRTLHEQTTLMQPHTPDPALAGGG